MLSLLSNKWQVVSGKIFIISACLAVSACGFQPVYGNKTALPANSPLISGVVIEAADGGITSIVISSKTENTNNSSYKIARKFSQNLEDLIYPSVKGASPAYKLEVTLSQSTSGIGISRDGTASRYNLTISSSYKLTRIADNKLIDTGSLSNVTSYNNPSNQYFSTYISEQDARKRGTEELAKRYLERLTAITEKTKPAEIKETQPSLMPMQINQNENRTQIN